MNAVIVRIVWSAHNNQFLICGPVWGFFGQKLRLQNFFEILKNFLFYRKIEVGPQKSKTTFKLM